MPDRAAPEDPRRRGSGRADARRSQRAIVEAAAQLMRERRPLTMHGVARSAGVSRSTLYRHFRSTAELQRGVQREALTSARTAIAGSDPEHGAPLAALRRATAALVGVGAQLPIDVPPAPVPEKDLDAVSDALRPLIERLADAAAIVAAPTESWLSAALKHAVLTGLRAGWDAPSDPAGTVERLVRAITEPLDRGLLLVDTAGQLVAINTDARDALAGVTRGEPGGALTIEAGGLYEDGSPAPPERHPLQAALNTGDAHSGIRGHHCSDGQLRWFFIEIRPLRDGPQDERYGFLATFTDVTDQRRLELAHLRPPGDLRARAAPLLDVVRALDEVPPPLLPDQLVAEATRLAGGPVALYVVDIDGSHLLRLAGREEFPTRITAPLALGPELAEDGLPDLLIHVSQQLPGATLAPMWLRGRAIGVLLALRGADNGLQEVARLGAAAMELAGGYTDVIDAARRRKDMNPAAEIQQSLIPPRIVRLGTGELAGSVLPSYEVGGDWFDYVENRDGAWIAIADAAGRGPQAGGLGGVALAALRAARRNDATLEEAARTMNETVRDVGGPEFFLTAIVARWHSVYSVFSWINCGHPPPLLLRGDDAQELATKPNLPLGLVEATMTFHRHQIRLLHTDRVVLYSDGVSRRRTREGLFGTEGIARAARSTHQPSATATARAIQEAVVSASKDPLPDDAAVVVFANTRQTEDVSRTGRR